ncbi:dihydrofolate reductase [Patescibacteria group bacterium]|nr:dihydrofolate reductase [Patescibacteria group bacterium]MBU1683191.1 dihydrofolate reductase [Patescibacteria group bacterium]MBU1935561.1 dihydrofolate reductase [Patescibacteria group bacterium]
MIKKIYLIVAADLKNGIGIKGKLPWQLKGDMRFFQKKTTKSDNANKRNMVVMGRVTWESIPEDHRPLMGRKNVVITRNKDFVAPGAEVAHSLEKAIEAADERIETIFIIGGAKVYQQAISRKDLTGIYLTRVKNEFKCDTFFPKIPPRLKPKKISEREEDGIKYEFLLYKKEK